MPSVAKVLVDISLDREFDYSIPGRLSSSIQVGSRVTVPFGKRRVTGYVVGLADKSHVERLRDIESAESGGSFIDSYVLELARWMSDYYCCPVEQAVRAVLPAAVRKKGAGFKKRLWVEPVAMTSREVVDELRKDDIPDGAGARLSVKQQAVLDFLKERDGAFLGDLTKRLGITAAPVKSLEKKGLVAVRPESSFRDPNSNRRILPTKPFNLITEQAAALDLVRKSLDTHDPPVVLLYGVTGSGKTEIYLQAIDHALKQDKGAIVLVPEISLTPQTVERFMSRFSSGIAVLHSHLSDGERHDEWHRVRSGTARIVIGARSAVFAPVRNLGLIVVDEEHEPSYKQEDAPRYSARDVAVMRGRMQGCSVVLGSATPCLESWHNAKKGKYGLAVMPDRADNRKMPWVRIVDMRLGSSEGKGGVFSRELLDAMSARLEQKEQTILFLNRRGFSTSLVCKACGYVAACEHCSVSYTYHRSVESLRCHICGASRKVPARCPGCGDPAFKYSGVGTQKIEAIVKKCFPHARVERMDADVTTRKDSYDRILGDFRSGHVDILIGTQMIAKGLHFPNVTLVGVVYADLSLHMPDFRAGERTFQLLAQVAGRAGRGERPGEVIVQTFTPFHQAVQAARRLDYVGFCDQEIEFRRELKYPPFSHLACITLKGPSEEQVSFAASAVRREMRKSLPERVHVSDPAPAPLMKAMGMYRYQVMLKSAAVKTVTPVLRDTLANLKLPPKVSVSVDVDALNLM